MTRSGWYPDPTGRFPRRWHDGHDWTASVVDNEGQQGYDALPAAPAVPALPGSTPPTPPPPVPNRPSAPAQLTPPSASPAAGPPPSWQADASWQPGQAWPAGAHPPVAPPMQAYQQPTPPPGWQPGRAPATPLAPTSGTTPQGRNPLVLVVAGVAVGLFVVSLFVLDWAESVTYGDLRTLVSAQDGSGVADNAVKLHMSWLGYAWAAVAIVAVGMFVIGRVGSHRAGHVLAALAAGVGAVLATFVIVRLFRGPDDPEFGVWLLPAGYLVLVAAVLMSARRDPH